MTDQPSKVVPVPRGVLEDLQAWVLREVPIGTRSATWRATKIKKILAAAPHQEAPTAAPQGGGEFPFIAGNVWRLEGAGEDGEDIWQSEVQVVGGHSIVATCYGATETEAEQRRDAILAALKPQTPDVLGEEGGAMVLLREFRDFARSGKHFSYPLGALQRLDGILAARPSQSDEGQG